MDTNMIDLLVSYADLEGKGEGGGECSGCLNIYGVDRACSVPYGSLAT
jgi:hypothetical protein